MVAVAVMAAAAVTAVVVVAAVVAVVAGLRLHPLQAPAPSAQ